MPWADSQALLNQSVMHVYGVDAVVLATGEPLRGSYFRPFADAGGDGYLGASPMSIPDAHLDVADSDAVKTPNGTEIRVGDQATVYTVADAQPMGTGWTRLSLREYGNG